MLNTMAYYWSRLQPVLTLGALSKSPLPGCILTFLGLKQAKSNLPPPPPMGKKQQPDVRLSCLFACPKAEQPMWFCWFFWYQPHSWVYFHGPSFCTVSPTIKCKLVTATGESPGPGRRGRDVPLEVGRVLSWFSFIHSSVG